MIYSRNSLWSKGLRVDLLALNHLLSTLIHLSVKLISLFYFHFVLTRNLIILSLSRLPDDDRDICVFDYYVDESGEWDPWISR